MRNLLPGLLALGAAALPRPAHAIGFELTTPGAREAGRAGASVVGADNAMALFYNPATLLNAKAFTDTAIALHNSWTDLCFTRQAVIEDAGGGRTGGAAFPEICGDAKTSIIPVGASVFRFNDKFAISYGVYSPPSAGRNIKFGNASTGTADGSTPTSAAGLSPSRYVLMKENILLTFPTIGAAWAPFKQLKVGASFGWGFNKFSFATATYSRSNTGQILGMDTGGTSDVGNYVKGKDKFIPRVNVGVWGKPVERIPLELGAQYVWTGDVETSDGQLRLRNLYTTYFPAALSSGFAQPQIDANLKKTGVKVPQNSVLTAGVRYAKKLAEPVGKFGDRMSSELFDVELDFAASFNRLDAVTVTPPANATVLVPSPSPLVMDQTLQLPDEIKLPHKWQTQYAIRIGGDYNVLPNLLTVRAGYGFESSGVKDGYALTDFTPFKRYSISLGATVRIIDLIDVSASYVQFFIPDVTNSVNDAGVRRVITGDATPNEAEIANAGKITQTAQSFIVEVGIHL